MVLRVYEYQIQDKKVGTYTGSYTIPVNSKNEKELAKKYKAKCIDEFEH